jgi:predicted RNA methylase
MPKVILPYFQSPTGKYIYCCENDHGMVEKLEETLKGKATVVTCMVDRISIDRKVEKNNIYAISEPYEGEIVILNPPVGAFLPAFKGKNVNVPKSKAAADYFCRRKIGIVNGMHTTLAFISLLDKCKGDTAEDVDLLAPEKATSSQKEMIRDFMVARLLLILYEHDTSVIKRAHNLTTDKEVAQALLDYGEATLKRYNTIEDKTSRVLGGGVANRWSTRLCNVKRFLDGNKNLKETSALLIRISGVKESRMRKNVDKLVKESERFVGQKPTWEVGH